jgi:hypothetical protein
VSVIKLPRGEIGESAWTRVMSAWTQRVRADVLGLRGPAPSRPLPPLLALPRVRTKGLRPHRRGADALMRLHGLGSPSLASSLPSFLLLFPPFLPSLPRVRAENQKIKKIFFFFSFFFGSCCLLEKKGKKMFDFRFPIPKIPELCGRSREKKKVFSA